MGARSTSLMPRSFSDGFSYALKRLSERAYSERALAVLLRKKGCQEAHVDRIIGRLRELKLLDDERMAREVYDRLQQQKLSGRFRVSAVLKRKKVSREMRAKVMSHLDSAEEEDRAWQVAKAYEEKWKNVPKMRRIKRIYDALVRRGFEFELCRETVEKLM